MKKALLFASVFAITVLTAVLLLVLPASAEVYSGNCGADGDNVTWSLDSATGVLAISGTGDMADITTTSPWGVYSPDIKSVTIGDSVTGIGANAFMYCSQLKSVTIGSSVTSIRSCAFYGCVAVTDVTIPTSVQTIGYKSFMSCGLKRITIPQSVTSIGDSAFYWCESLEKVTYLGTEEQWQLVVVGSENEVLLNKLEIKEQNSQNNNGGCGSVISGGLSMMALIALAGGMIAVKKKR